MKAAVIGRTTNRNWRPRECMEVPAEPSDRGRAQYNLRNGAAS